MLQFSITPARKQITITLHSFDAPRNKICEVIIKANDSKFTGSNEQLKIIPRYYVGYLENDERGDYKLITLDVEKQRVELSSLDWFDDSYDKGYQGVLDVIEIPETGNLLFSIQRNSSPILFNPIEKEVVQKVKLAGRAGNPIFTFRNQNKEIWCVDYDTLLKMDSVSFKIINKARLQLPSLGFTQQFIGDFAFTKDENYCAVARPFSKDVILLKSSNLKVVSRVKFKDEPLGIAVLSSLDFIYRDWKSGKVGFGRFKVKKFLW